jgi:hypothetical protein
MGYHDEEGNYNLYGRKDKSATDMRKEEEKKKKYDMLYLKTIFNEILDDTKDLLDDYFVNALDRDAQTSIAKVNKADHVGFYGRYRIIGNYAKGDKTLSGYAKTFGSLTEDFLDIETGVKHLEMQFKNESIFGEEFPITTFTHTINVTFNDRGLSYEFVLDMKF